MPERSSITEVLSNLDIGESLDVIIHRYSSNSGHFIAYPEKKNFDGTEDGIHINPSQTLTTDLRSIIDHKGVVAHGKIEVAKIEGGYPLGTIKSLGKVRFEDYIDSIQRITNDEINNHINTLDDAESISLDGKVSFEIQITWKKEQPENGCGTESSNEIEAAERFPPTDDPNQIRVYYLTTSNAECYHSTRTCRGLQKREGIIRSAIKEVNKPNPEEIKNLRKCHWCH